MKCNMFIVYLENKCILVIITVLNITGIDLYMLADPYSSSIARIVK